MPIYNPFGNRIALVDNRFIQKNGDYRINNSPVQRNYISRDNGQKNMNMKYVYPISTPINIRKTPSPNTNKNLSNVK
jgi:hypothetical protein